MSDVQFKQEESHLVKRIQQFCCLVIRSPMEAICNPLIADSILGVVLCQLQKHCVYSWYLMLLFSNPMVGN